MVLCWKPTLRRNLQVQLIRSLWKGVAPEPAKVRLRINSYVLSWIYADHVLKCGHPQREIFLRCDEPGHLRILVLEDQIGFNNRGRYAILKMFIGEHVLF